MLSNGRKALQAEARTRAKVLMEEPASLRNSKKSVELEESAQKKV